MSEQATGMRIAVYGLGHVGLTAAACMAAQGHEIIGVDISEDKVGKVNASVSPIKEPGLEELVAKAGDCQESCAWGRLTFIGP